ncbi:MAG: hypothetical protein MHM6MM_006282, partial [Cercozoa sp. M6MM]
MTASQVLPGISELLDVQITDGFCDYRKPKLPESWLKEVDDRVAALSNASGSGHPQ